MNKNFLIENNMSFSLRKTVVRSVWDENILSWLTFCCLNIGLWNF